MSRNDSHLSIVKTTSLPEPRNYWNTVGKNLEFFPTTPRPNSIPKLSSTGKVLQEPKDEWWVNSSEHHYCFWEFVRKNSKADGTMEPLQQAEIANLLGCSSTKVHFLIKSALEELKSEKNLKLLEDLFEMCQEEPGNFQEDVMLTNQISGDEESDS